MVRKRERTVTRADTTGKKRKSIDTKADIISNLPIEVLYKIVECLPVQDAVRTSVLSHKWHRICTSSRSLVFDDQFITTVFKQKANRKTLQFCSIISNILQHHEGPIDKFALSVPYVKHPPDVTKWMSYLSKHAIRDFSLYNYKPYRFIDLGSELYSWVGLEELKLKACGIKPAVKFRGFPKLTVLELVNVFIPYSILKDVIGNCPLLQKLELTDCRGLVQQNIIIDAPKLTHFVINSEHRSLKIKNGNNLVSASINMKNMAPLYTKACCHGLINTLQCSSKLETLALGGYMYRVLFGQGYRPNTFQKLRNLELSLVLNNMDDVFSTIDYLRSLPNIERLNITVRTSQNSDDNVLDYNPDWTLQHLRCGIVSICSASNAELKLIECLLECAPVLEKLSLLISKSVTQSKYSKMLTQLNQFRRLS